MFIVQKFNYNHLLWLSFNIPQCAIQSAPRFRQWVFRTINSYPFIRTFYYKNKTKNTDKKKKMDEMIWPSLNSTLCHCNILIKHIILFLLKVVTFNENDVKIINIIINVMKKLLIYHRKYIFIPCNI